MLGPLLGHPYNRISIKLHKQCVFILYSMEHNDDHIVRIAHAPGLSTTYHFLSISIRVMSRIIIWSISMEEKESRFDI